MGRPAASRPQRDTDGRFVLRYLAVCARRLWHRLRLSHLLQHPMRLFGLLIVLITGMFLPCIVMDDNGATYTGFGSLFTAYAFAGVIVTVLLQRAELQEQRKELRAQRIELEGQKRELEIQNRTAQLQRFENSFFNLLNIFKGTLYTIKNKNIFPTEKDFPDLLPDEYCTTSQQYFKKTSRCLHIANAGYDETISYLKKDLSNLSYDTKVFLKNYHLIINFIISCELFKTNNGQEYIYINTVNNLLTNNEFLLIIIDAICFPDKIKIINKYHLLSNFSLEEDDLPEYFYVLFFAPQAFGDDYEEYIRLNGLQGKTLEDFLQQ